MGVKVGENPVDILNRTDIPIPISYFNQMGLYGVGMYVLGFRK